MDLSMPVLDGVEATRAVLQAVPGDAGRRADVVLGPRAGAAGARGRRCRLSAEGCRAAMCCAKRSGRPLEVTPRSTRGSPGCCCRAAGVADPLSPREREVLALVAEGMANKQIARALGITERTVKAHLGSAFRQIGVGRPHECRDVAARSPDGSGLLASDPASPGSGRMDARDLCTDCPILPRSRRLPDPPRRVGVDGRNLARVVRLLRLRLLRGLLRRPAVLRSARRDRRDDLGVPARSRSPSWCARSARSLFGYMGDRLGRRTTLLWTIGIMGVATGLIGLLPDLRAGRLARRRAARPAARRAGPLARRRVGRLDPHRDRALRTRQARLLRVDPPARARPSARSSRPRCSS